MAGRRAETKETVSEATQTATPPLTRAPSQTKKVKSKKKSTSNNVVKLACAAVVGVLLAMWFARDKISMGDLGAMEGFWDDISSHLPASVLREAQAISQRRADAQTGDAFSVGRKLKKEGLQLEFPVVMIPGVISTGLESWVTDGCGAPYYRKRLWGSWSMLRAMLVDKSCWSRSIALDPVTGLDPADGVAKLRAAQGFDASDFFITGYWIWNKILENLSVIGGDPNNMFTAAYDWRLSFSNLENRDGYFSRLKMHIEAAVHTHGKKTVIVSHSMGSQVFFYFMKWVAQEGEGFGNGGKDWVNQHIHTWINVSGSMLGTPKTVAALVSGEMKDTAQLSAFSVYGLETFFSKKERAQILRTMPGIASMLPKGHNKIWGDNNGAPDDPENLNGTTYGSFLKFKTPAKIALDADSVVPNNMTMEDSFEYLLQHTSHDFHRMLATNYSHGVAETHGEVRANDYKPEKWINPLETALPDAPDMKIFCMYGVGKPTERTYYYEQSKYEAEALQGDLVNSGDLSKIEEEQNKTQRTPLDIPFTRSSFIDNSVSIKHDTEKGVQMGEGDGTVSLLSSGYMCNEGWKMPRYNPAGIEVVTYEMMHEEDVFDLRGGPKTADHVDILGRAELSELILKVAAGHGGDIEPNIVSDIRKYIEKIDIAFN
ncbi:Putative uncharacterized protein [Taphrina deformans PYCC 5710]|uniref:Phospholipid:diacylglycerol acyltransferase n=1 Tax=Taphrina deformans (strain PYCC 5710 / ATCC 11124 / CBS 356.35 / IMI 108563 / JCM 9778 / NBRC 8474) TaxID=1097556 RepID=R4XEL7_TAPDE|nr:Putative uncharacterized protein [Taphrina deformans PYCC 5710]|eukprot:CCG81812.1 Putative uncharacterized protein [Taphrina deformans PYCC 5710]